MPACSRVSNRPTHWLEIFDAISDLIVVHDETDKVLRVKPLAGCHDWRRSRGTGSASTCAPFSPSPLNPHFIRAPFAVPWAKIPTNTFIPRSTALTSFQLHGFNGAAGEGLQTIHVLKTSATDAKPSAALSRIV